MSNNANQPSVPMMIGGGTPNVPGGFPTLPLLLNALNAAVQIQDVEFVSIQLSAGLVGTIIFEQSNDGQNWVICPLSDPTTTAQQIKVQTSVNPAATMLVGPVPGRFFRVRVSAYTSGSASCLIAGYFQQINSGIQNIAGFVSPNASALGGYNYTRISTATSTNAIKASAGYLKRIIVGTPIAAGVVTVFDAATAAGTTITTITVPAAAANPFVIDCDLRFATALSILTSAATDITAVWA
jgi:hypothetical protein